MTQRKIIHIDMDAFYASVEQRDNPELRGKPLAVGHAEERGVVAAASYEARRYGVRSAMASQKAKRLCPQLIFVPGRMDVYKSVSRQIHEIFHEYTDIIEPLSLDEAFLDVTENKKDISLAVDIAKEIKQKIREQLNLVASAGVSYNKFLAKIASDYRKPDGLCTIHPEQALDFIARLPIESFWGVGPVTAKKMHLLGIHNGLQLRKCSLEMLTAHFGKAGALYYECSRGIDERPVEAIRIRKSIGCERTLERDISARSSVIIELYHVAVNGMDENSKATLLDIVDTPISPELIPADENGEIKQKTEDLVGPYELHDFFLYYFLRFGFRPSKIFYLANIAFKDMYDEKTIKKWLSTFFRRFFNQQFKRSCLPDGPKVGSISISPRGDWRMPSDASSAMWLKEIEAL